MPERDFEFRGMRSGDVGPARAYIAQYGEDEFLSNFIDYLISCDGGGNHDVFDYEVYIEDPLCLCVHYLQLWEMISPEEFFVRVQQGKEKWEDPMVLSVIRGSIGV